MRSKIDQLIMLWFCFFICRDGTKLSKRQGDIHVEHFRVRYLKSHFMSLTWVLCYCSSYISSLSDVIYLHCAICCENALFEHCCYFCCIYCCNRRSTFTPRVSAYGEISIFVQGEKGFTFYSNRTKVMRYEGKITSR